jgi:branched-chain amino acid transport system ATP-binding protein
MLSISGLQAGYGRLVVLRGISLEVPKGRIVALLGGNGAGKTTTLRAIAGLIPVRAGEVRLADTVISTFPSHRIFAAGIALVPQGRELFPEMTVAENLELGALAARTRNKVGELTAELYTRFPRLRERARQRAASLSGGEQQMLAMGRALMSQPEVMLLDEPTTGLAPLIVRELARTIVELNQAGQTILLVEQNVKMALAVAHDAYVIRQGEIVLHAPAAELRSSDELYRAYLA